MSEYLFSNQASDGASSENIHLGGMVAIYVWGSLGGGTVYLEIRSPDASTWITISQESWTAEDVKTIQLPPCRYRLKLIGSSGASVSASCKGY